MKIIESLKNFLSAFGGKVVKTLRYLIPVYLLWKTDTVTHQMSAAVTDALPVEFKPQTSRKINEIIVHCTASPAMRHVTVDEIRHLHVDINGWDDVGYHFLIYIDGTVVPGRPVEIQGAHCRGHNESTIGIAYVGGLLADGVTPADTRTDAQKKSLVALVSKLVKQYPVRKISSHSDYAAKACPCFNASAEYSRLLD